ncbi:MAG: FAD-dependent thymidylate synthase [Elusimicrobiota bacterium]|jgi:thymidylate synthase (FAD)
MKEIKVLDKGFVRLVDAMASDAGVVEAARVSYAGTSKGEEKDKGLIAYLLEHQHLTPLEHAVFKFHIKCPIFVARQWFRHRWSSYNEVSYRYTQSKDEYYIPQSWRGQDHKNKQGSVSAKLDDKALTQEYVRALETASAAYNRMIEAGVAREMARMALPVALYTEFYWSVNARSLINFLSLRADAHAQLEIQAYAEALASFFSKAMPWTYEAFLTRLWKGENPKLASARATALNS